MRLSLVTPPAAEPITLAAAKLHLRQDHDADDTLITGLIAAARAVVETRLRRALVTQTWDLALDGFPPTDRAAAYPLYVGAAPGYPETSIDRAILTRFPIALPMPPVASVASVTYTAPDGTVATLDPSLYTAQTGTPAAVYPAYGRTWPATRAEPGAVTVRYTAGYGDAADVPYCIKAAMMLLVGDWYEHREAGLEGTITERLEHTVDLLLSPEEWGSYQ